MLQAKTTRSAVGEGGLGAILGRGRDGLRRTSCHLLWRPTYKSELEKPEVSLMDILFYQTDSQRPGSGSRSAASSAVHFFTQISRYRPLIFTGGGQKVRISPQFFIPFFTFRNGTKLNIKQMW